MEGGELERESEKHKKKMRGRRKRNEITAREKSRTQQCPPSFLNVHYLCISAETPVANPFLCHIC